MDSMVIVVEELGRVRRRGEGMNDGGVPIMVRREKGGLVGFYHVDDEGLWMV